MSSSDGWNTLTKKSSKKDVKVLRTMPELPFCQHEGELLEEEGGLPRRNNLLYAVQEGERWGK